MIAIATTTTASSGPRVLTIVVGTR